MVDFVDREQSAVLAVVGQLMVSGQAGVSGRRVRRTVAREWRRDRAPAVTRPPGTAADLAKDSNWKACRVSREPTVPVRQYWRTRGKN